MKLILSSISKNLKEAWEKAFCDLDSVEFHHGSILNAKCDAVVSPANSFGFMDGGIDALYKDYFGADIEIKVKRQILKFHFGELPVGNADVVETHNNLIPFMIMAPTMRVPMIIKDSLNPFLAARAIFILVKYGSFRSGKFEGEKISDHIKSIAIPGLGTGVGKMDPSKCARQVRQAYNDFFLYGNQMPKSCDEALLRHQLLNS